MNQTRTGPTGQRFDLIGASRRVRAHSPEARELLRRAGLSQQSELDSGQLRVLNEYVEAYGDDPASVPGHSLRVQLLPSLRGVDGLDPVASAELPTNESKGESIMAKAKAQGRPKRKAPSKSEIAKVASMRRDGATWDEVIAETGIRTNSTGFRELLESAGFDKYGRKAGSNQKSKAKGWGSAQMKSNGSAPKAKGKARKKVVRRKATAKK